MAFAALVHIKNKLAAQICSFVFKTPLPYPKTSEQRRLIRKAEAYFYRTRESIYTDGRLGYCLHRWKPYSGAPKAIICHGWSSRALYMAGVIRTLVENGFEVHALDFPAHGEGKGFQLEWMKAPECILDCQKRFGPYQCALGHSFGGTMIIAAECVYKYAGHIEDVLAVDKVVLIGTPVRIATPLKKFSQAFKLNPVAEEMFTAMQVAQAGARIHQLDGKVNIDNTDSHYLVIHDPDDTVIPVSDALYFCNDNPKATLHMTRDLGHVKALYDDDVMAVIRDFLT